MGAVWTFKDASWEQDDENYAFRISEIKGKPVASSKTICISPQQLLGARTHRVTNKGDHCAKKASFFPPDFKCCPFCGEALTVTAPLNSPAWVPPYGAGNGLKIYPHQLQGAQTLDPAGEVFPIPPIGERFTFFSTRLGAQDRLLFGLEHSSGRLWVFNTSAQSWQGLDGNIPIDEIPAWSWSIAFDSAETGVLIPTDWGVAWVTVDWARSTLCIDQVKGTTIGGAARLGSNLVIPILKNDLIVFLYREEGSYHWLECLAKTDSASVLAALVRTSKDLAYLGVPTIDENRMVIYWPARGGYIKVTGFCSTTGLSWEFRQWQYDEFPATALIELGPPLRLPKQTGLWQLCEDIDRSVRGGVVNKIIKYDGDPEVDAEVVACGQFLTTGRASFSWSDDYWNDIHQRNPRAETQEELRLPLLQFGEKGQTLITKVLPWDGRDDPTADDRFSANFFNRSAKIPVYVRFAIEGADVPEKALEIDGHPNFAGYCGSTFGITLSNALEITSFIHGQHLFIYIPERNECFRWSLQVSSS